MKNKINNKVLLFLLQWNLEGIKNKLLKLMNEPNIELSIYSMMEAMQNLPIEDLYQVLTRRFTWDEIIESFVYIFENDPSYFQDAPIKIERFFEEKPFPRYVTAICYMLIGKCFEQKDERLKEPIWNNIIHRNPAVIEPPLTFGILKKLFETDELVERSIQLLSTKDKTQGFIRNTLMFYISGEGIENIIQIIQQKLTTETDPEKVFKYKKQLRKSHTRLMISKLDRIAAKIFKL